MKTSTKGRARGGGRPGFVKADPPPDGADSTGFHWPVTVRLDDVAAATELIDDFLGAGVSECYESCDVSDLACFIHNQGKAIDRAEGLLAITPIARRVFDRWNAEQRQRRVADFAEREKQAAAVKGKKIGKGGASNGV